MVLEYILLLAMSLIILAFSFSPQNGPVAMFQDSGLKLGSRVEKRLVTGHGFQEKWESSSWRK